MGYTLDFDLCVIATGKFTIDLHLNRLLHQSAHAPTTVFTWLEPYGIGGHALLVHPKQTGCLQCLFVEDSETGNPLRDRSAFAAPNQWFGHDSLGCGSSYTQYSALDAQKTADLAVRLALKAATRRELNNPMLSWRGDAHDFLAAGYQVSARYQKTPDQLADSQFHYVRRDCPICNGAA